MPDQTRQDIPALIREAMEQQGITTAELARRAPAVSRAAMYEYLGGRHDLSGERVAILLAAVGLEIRPARRRRRGKPR